MAFDEKGRTSPALEQAAAPDAVRSLLSTLVQETMRAEFERFGRSDQLFRLRHMPPEG
jgi:hypothetical protein